MAQKKRTRKKPKVKLKWHKVLIFFIALGAITYGAWYGAGLYNESRNIFNNQNVVVSIEAPTAINTYDIISYAIDITNKEAIPLIDGNFSIEYPDNFTVQKTTPQATQSNNQWEIDFLDVGKTRTITIEGFYTDNPGTAKLITSSYSFTPTNFTSKFTKSSTHSLVLSAPSLTLDLDLPKEFIGEITQPGTITVKNNTDALIKNPEIVLFYDIPVTVSTDAATIKNSTEQYTVLKLSEPLETGKMLTLDFNIEPKQMNGNQTDVLFEAQLLTGESGNQLASDVHSANFISKSLYTYIIVNGSTSNAELSTKLSTPISFVIKNYSDAVFSNGKIIVTLAIDNIAQIFGDVSNIKNAQQVSASEWQITLDSSDIQELAELNPEKEVVYTLTLPKPNVNAISTSSMKVLATLEAERNIEDSEETQVQSFEAGELLASFESDIQLVAQTNYGATQQGPIPPKVNKKTIVPLTFEVSNTLYNMENIEMSTQLPKYVEIEKMPSASVGTITYDQLSRTLTWKINRLPKDFPTPSAIMDVSITPLSTQRGQLLRLTEQLKLNAYDTRQKKNLELEYTALDMNLAGETEHEGFGIVE